MNFALTTIILFYNIEHYINLKYPPPSYNTELANILVNSSLKSIIFNFAIFGAAQILINTFIRYSKNARNHVAWFTFLLFLGAHYFAMKSELEMLSLVKNTNSYGFFYGRSLVFTITVLIF